MATAVPSTVTVPRVTLPVARRGTRMTLTSPASSRVPVAVMSKRRVPVKRSLASIISAVSVAPKATFRRTVPPAGVRLTAISRSLVPEAIVRSTTPPVATLRAPMVLVPVTCSTSPVPTSGAVPAMPKVALFRCTVPPLKLKRAKAWPPLPAST